MRIIVTLLVIFLSLPISAQNSKAVTLRSILLEQLRTTHNQKDWFVPIDVAVEGISAEQASWKDGSGNHSVGQLTNHLLFWNAAGTGQVQRRAGKEIQRQQRRNLQQLRQQEVERYR